MQSPNKKKILFVGDYNSPSGFSNVHGRIIEGFSRQFYDVVIQACNFNGYLPGMANVYGSHSAYAMNEIARTIEIEKPDILITSNDGFVMPQYANAIKPYLKNLIWVQAVIFDSTPIDYWVQSTLLADVVVVPTEWQKQEILKQIPEVEVVVIPYGVDTEIYRPWPGKAEYKERLFGKQNADRFVFGMVSKNFIRKRFPELISAFARFLYDGKTEFKYGRPMLVLYTTNDMNAEFDLQRIAKLHNFQNYDMAVLSCDKTYFTEEEMNQVYNLFDVNCLISLGEGYGLSTFQTAAIGIPTIACDNSVQIDFEADSKSMFLCKSLDQPTFFSHDGAHIRFLPDVNSLREELERAYNIVGDATERKAISENAKRFAAKHNWGKFASMWNMVLKNLPSAEERNTRVI